MTTERIYATPGAFRRALTDKLKALAPSSRWGLPQLQRQIAYDRLLARLYLIDRGWVVKGATALLARDLGVRGTIDIDLYRDVALDTALRELREAAATDLGDWFTFELGGARAVSDGANGSRVPVKALIGPTVWASFQVDLVGSELTMTGEPEQVPPLARVGMPDVKQTDYQAYPLVDHVADKVVAIFDRYGPSRLPSTRYKDLVDLVAIATGASVEASAQMRGLTSEAGRRAVDLPDHFDVPDRTAWERGYAAEAGRSLLDVAQTLDEALAIVDPFLDPLLAGEAKGRWNPELGAWVQPVTLSGPNRVAARGSARRAGTTS